ncbi:MAG: hypothetical protein WCD76_06815, partial [Pyrinomonadaceae bacterium]
MNAAGPVTDKIFTRPPHFTLRYRSGPSLHWTSEARPDYGVLLLLEGSLNWQAADGETGELETGGALLAG